MPGNETMFGMGIQFQSRGAAGLMRTFDAVRKKVHGLQMSIQTMSARAEASMARLNGLRMKGFIKVMGGMVAAAALFYPAIAAFSKFNAVMTQVGIVSGNTGTALKEFNKELEPFVRRLGILSEFSPKEVSEALYEIASSGRATIKELKALTPHVMAISTMSGQTVALGDAAMLLVQTMAKFGNQFEVLEKQMHKPLGTMQRLSNLYLR